MGSCRELAEDRDAVSRMSVFLDNLEKNGTPTAHLLPWFPSQARRAIVRNNRAIFELVNPFVEIRRAATERRSDTIDLLFEVGFPPDTVVEVRPFFPPSRRFSLNRFSSSWASSMQAISIPE
jgi:sterol 14-demethylase